MLNQNLKGIGRELKV